jgi:hypothetical protein
VDNDPKWCWMREYRRGVKLKSMNLDCGRLISTWMMEAGFDDVKTEAFRSPYWNSGAEKERKMVQLSIGDEDGYWWHAIPRMVKGLGHSEDDIKAMQLQSRETVKEERGKFQKFWVTYGRKPDN